MDPTVIVNLRKFVRNSEVIELLAIVINVSRKLTLRHLNRIRFRTQDLAKELRRNMPAKMKITDSPAVRFTLATARKHRETDERLCLQRQELINRLDTFTVYLQSSRRVAEITKQYHSHGERSIEEAASLVGLGLPKTKA
ncbi:protein FMC1 homolog [Varroa destructor]|uniref:Protein FMC1 homolog n=1 Tax=Varroa destructor TaxID=109461 RepID=A0A7M7KSB7_VARDE|nr:protein FMC1 homolog [Varroa destructor]